MLITIKVFGPNPPCRTCQAAERLARNVAAEFTGVEVVKLDALSDEADKYNVMLTPTVVVGENVVCSGRLPTSEELKTALRALA